MEERIPKPQTIASKKYQDKVGLMSKAYKLKREVVEAFADACNTTGVSQAYQLTKMMNEYIDQVNREQSKKHSDE